MSSSYSQTTFSIPFEEHLLKGDLIIKNGGSPVLFLHGAGQSTRKLADPLRLALINQDIPSIAFDFIGHGETGGCLQSSSLQHRLLQASEVIEQLHISQPLSIVGSSMSGYTALKLLEKYEIKHLVLIVPAVYHSSAHSALFNTSFTDIIRKSLSWMETDAWHLIENFKNHLLLVVAEKDEVIPKEISQNLYHYATHAQSRQLHIVEDSSHKIGAFFSNHPLQLKKTVDLLANLFKSE